MTSIYVYFVVCLCGQFIPSHQDYTLDNEIADLRGLTSISSIRDIFMTGAFQGKNTVCTGSRSSGVNAQGVCKDFKSCFLLGGRGMGHCSVFGTCCLVEGTCNNTSGVKVSYFTSPSNLPTTFDGQGCSMRVRVLNRDVCQIRLDFETFILADPVSINNGYQCTNDYFTVSGVGIANNLGFNSLCGINTGQHIYIPVNNRNGDALVTLAVQAADRVANSALPSPSWRIRITQLECSASTLDYSSVQSALVTMYQTHINRKTNNAARDQDLIAPTGCLQYYNTPTGTYESFNHQNGAGNYLADLDYAICFRRTTDACSIIHTVQQFELNYNQVDGVNVCTPQGTTLGLRSNDYIQIPGGVFISSTNGVNVTQELYCDTQLQANNVVVSTTPGPFYVGVFTDSLQEGPRPEQGFRINYEISNRAC